MRPRYFSFTINLKPHAPPLLLFFAPFKDPVYLDDFRKTLRQLGLLIATLEIQEGKIWQDVTSRLTDKSSSGERPWISLNLRLPLLMDERMHGKGYCATLDP